LNPWLSYGIVFIGGYVDVNNNDAASLLTFRVDDIATEYYSYKKTIITDFHIEMPFTITSKYVSFTIGPYIGNYHVDEHYIYTADYGLWQKYGTRDIDNHDIINYLVPGVSMGVSIQLPLESYVVMELSTLRIGHTILSYDGIGFGIRKSLF
jgi:hypothetical protein